MPYKCDDRAKGQGRECSPTISVAIATYNRAHILPETLEYIFRQTYSPTQIVVVNDGSSDTTDDLLESYGGAIIHRRIQNSGPGAALKAAVEMCTGEWIAFCDDDDKWHPDHLERRVRLMEHYPVADYTFSNFTSFGPDALPDFNEFSNMPQDWWDDFPAQDIDGYQWLGRHLFPKFLDYNPVFPTTVCMKRDLYERCGGIDERFSRLGCWDAHFTWRCVLHGASACDRSITAETRKHLGNFSKKRSRINLERAEMLETAWADQWIPAGFEGQIAKAINDSRITAAWWAWHDSDYEFLQQVAKGVDPEAMPKELKIRILLSYLPFLKTIRSCLT